MKEKVLEIINAILEDKEVEKLASLDPKMHLIDDIGLDSIDLVELAERTYEEYNINIFEDGMISTIDDIYKKLEN